MDCIKMGEQIRALRKEQELTQKELADRLNVSDKTVSKWERGQGYPDISLLGNLSDILGVNIGELLDGEIIDQEETGGNMKNVKYYVCTQCGNISLCTGNAAVTCCGRKLAESEARKAEQDQRLTVELVEDEWYITSQHPMTKEHYISFIAFATGNKLEVVKQYPEWSVHMRIPRRGHGKLLWFDTREGLYYQLL